MRLIKSSSFPFGKWTIRYAAIIACLLLNQFWTRRHSEDDKIIKRWWSNYMATRGDKHRRREKETLLETESLSFHLSFSFWVEKLIRKRIKENETHTKEVEGGGLMSVDEVNNISKQMKSDLQWDSQFLIFNLGINIRSMNKRALHVIFRAFVWQLSRD